MERREREVLGEDSMERAIARITHEILERNQGTKDVVLIGIRTGGVYLADRIREKIRQLEGAEVPMGVIDIALYRDDFAMALPRPRVGKTEIPFPLKDRKVILVDDVLFTGRTVRAAMDALIDFGRPKFIQLGVLVDRGHRELPIQADYVGKRITTVPQEEVTVRFRELDGEDRVVIQDAAPKAPPSAPRKARGPK
ncbi:MAG TPA: bifunctional pyr operon transcriptional regulator/uracil phosphoribosyltransferase PyrR [Thermodesulfobacteriota bacterium]|nr:bifunctional pyr operon transcriptional regulator/uracil phosphoribosyltransferase PyrR [Thermodesulfobacteriota bacterium]